VWGGGGVRTPWSEAMLLAVEFKIAVSSPPSSQKLGMIPAKVSKHYSTVVVTVGGGGWSIGDTPQLLPCWVMTKRQYAAAACTTRGKQLTLKIMPACDDAVRQRCRTCVAFCANPKHKADAAIPHAANVVIVCRICNLHQESRQTAKTLSPMMRLARPMSRAH
jgi:hypothetical protein